MEAVSLELVMFTTQRFAAEKPVVLKRVADSDEPARSMIEGEVVNQPMLPLVHAPPVPPASVAQLSPLQRPLVPPTQYWSALAESVAVVATAARKMRRADPRTNENKRPNLQLELDPPTLTSSLLPLNFKLLPPPVGFFASYKAHEFILSCFGLYKIGLLAAY